jgi:hypothetical protein
MHNSLRINSPYRAYGPNISWQAIVPQPNWDPQPNGNDGEPVQRGC